MSYCRWSSDNWKCDLYCYEDVSGGWTTHVAGRRRVGEIPDDRREDFFARRISAEEFFHLHNRQMEVLGTLPMEDIDLPHAGETFHDGSLQEFKDRLLMLRKIGYHFPDYVLTDIDEEIANAPHDA